MQPYLYSAAIVANRSPSISNIRRLGYQIEVIDITGCITCGSRIFWVDETVTLPEIDGKPIKTLGSGGLHPEIYETYRHLEGTARDVTSYQFIEKSEVLNYG